MKILLIGGTGVLSSAVASEALKKGIDVTMINRGNRNIPQGVSLIKSDCSNYSYLANELINHHYDAVIDFLCYTEKQLIDSFIFFKSYTSQYFFISSCAVYNASLGGVMDEEGPKELKMWKYSVDKWACEQRLEVLSEQFGVSYTVVRPCVTYGDTRIPYGISPQYGYHWTLCSRILNGKPLISWNKGENHCNMTRVEDFSFGVVGLIGNPLAYNQAFNVCGDDAPSFKEVLDVLRNELRKEVVTVDVTPNFYARELPSRAGEILGGRSIDSINSNEKIKVVVPEFNQNIKLDEGIKMTLEAYKQQNYQCGIDWTFDADTDRIIKKWCKKNHIDFSQYNLGFIDYLGTATKKDRQTYWLTFHKDNVFVKTYLFGCLVANKIKRTIIG